MAEPMDRWSGGDVVLITYADTVGDEGVPGLQALKSFVNRHLHAFAAVIHVLPFLQSTSDGGFAVASHTTLEQRFGDWRDLAALAQGRRLMADLVLNHVSASHPWVQQFMRDEQPGRPVCSRQPRIPAGRMWFVRAVPICSRN